MNISKILAILFFVALLGGGYYIYQQAINLKNPEFVKMENIKFKNVTLPPDLNGKKTTHITQDLEVLMAANSDFSLPLSFDIPVGEKEFFKNFKNMLNGAWKKKSVKIRSVGTITIKAINLNLDIPFDYDDEYRLEDYL